MKEENTIEENKIEDNTIEEIVNEEIINDEISNEELLDLHSSVEEHINYLNESILEEKEETEDETPTI